MLGSGSIENLHDLIEGSFKYAPLRSDGSGGDVRRNDNIVVMQQRVVRGKRLGLRDVETGAEQVTGVQGYLERSEEVADRRQRVLTLTAEGVALLAAVDRDRADQFLAVVRPMPMAERALVAMGVAALANHAVTQRGGLRRGPGGR